MVQNSHDSYVPASEYEKLKRKVTMLEISESTTRYALEQTIKSQAAEIEKLKEENHRLLKNTFRDPVKPNPRGAGRKEKLSSTVNRLSDLEAMLGEMTAADVATELGISRATLFKRLRAARTERDETGEDPFIL